LDYWEWSHFLLKKLHALLNRANRQHNFTYISLTKSSTANTPTMTADGITAIPAPPQHIK